jgi:hypothetical protein
MAGGTDNNQLKAAAEETVALAMATKTAAAMEMAMVTASTKMLTPTMAYQQQGRG